MTPFGDAAEPAWQALDDELRRWRALGRTATLWWRDDDAVADTPALARLAGVSASGGVPVALAVVPAALQPSLAEALAGWPLATPLQHGYAHTNHAAPPARKSEFGGERERASWEGDIRAGAARMHAEFGARALAVFVPPWNRIAAGVTASLPALGFRGLSTYTARATPAPAPGLVQVNCHVDVIDWRGTRGFAGAGPVLRAFDAHLRARRAGDADADEPTGVLTHHLVHDDACWRFLGTLTEVLGSRTEVRWCTAEEVFR